MIFINQTTGKEVWLNPANIVLIADTGNEVQITVQTPTANDIIISSLSLSELVKRIELSK